MHDTHQQSVDHLLSELGAGSSDAFDQMFPLVYDELHCIAERQRRRWQGDETLDTTALVNEAYLRWWTSPRRRGATGRTFWRWPRPPCGKS
jgi:DNA-directed RNA polymerase specialized sigma24 family protein